jgi:hypothetical protein
MLAEIIQLLSDPDTCMVMVRGGEVYLEMID